jgi:hypothetical protein
MAVSIGRENHLAGAPDTARTGQGFVTLGHTRYFFGEEAMKENVLLGRIMGMMVLNQYLEMDIDSMRFNNLYQRAIQRERWKRIFKSIESEGYWPQEVIILNELHEIIDGQHRVVAAKKLGIAVLPVSIVTFPNKQKEAEFFHKKNNWNTSLNPVDFWYARHLSGHPFACLLYRIVEDKSSLLYMKVAIKGHETNDSKFYLNDAISIINICALGVNHSWTKSNDEAITSLFIASSYEAVKASVDDFLLFFYGCFGAKKTSNPIPYKSHCIRPIALFYTLLRNGGLLKTESGRRSAINKMKEYVFTADFLKMTHSGRIFALCAHFNFKKKKGRIDYNPSSYEV